MEDLIARLRHLHFCSLSGQWGATEALKAGVISELGFG